MTRHGYIPLGGDNPPRFTYHAQGKFGRLFPTLPPFTTDNPKLREALKEIGKLGGIMDAKDDLLDPKALIIDPTKSLVNRNNPNLTRCLTSNLTSSLGKRTLQLNERSPPL